MTTGGRRLSLGSFWVGLSVLWARGGGWGEVCAIDGSGRLVWIGLGRSTVPLIRGIGAWRARRLVGVRCPTLEWVDLQQELVRKEGWSYWLV